MVQQAYQAVSPDVVLYPSFFEGWMEQGVVPLPNAGFPSALKVAIIYDFIPYLFPYYFLEGNLCYKDFYLKRLDKLKSFDLLLAISDSTKQDAIKILDLEPDKVINISAAVSQAFTKRQYTLEQTETTFSKWGILKPYVFYTGNVEHHKNVEMALRAFSQLPGEVRKAHQFVLTHTASDDSFVQKVRSIGLKEEEVITTDHVTDDELVMLYNNCKLFVFPSLYEGFRPTNSGSNGLRCPCHRF